MFINKQADHGALELPSGWDVVQGSPPFPLTIQSMKFWQGSSDLNFFNSMFGNMLIFCSFHHIISPFMPLSKFIKGASHKALQKIAEIKKKKKEKGVSCRRFSYLSLQICRQCIKSSPFVCLSHCTWRILCVCSCSLLAGLQQHLKISGKISNLLCSVLHLCAWKACPHP